MKSKLLLLFIVIIALSSCSRLKIKQDTAVPQYTQAFFGLFKDPARIYSPCPKENEKPEEETYISSPVSKKRIDGSDMVLPHKKRNNYELINQGWDASAYFFDYLDPLLQKPIVDEFNRILIEANKLQDDATYKDPYTLENLANLSGGISRQLTNQEMLIKLPILFPGLNPALWQTYISAAKMSTIVKEWNWDQDTTKSDWPKNIVDKFDFDGDGRLNPAEFILAMIYNNKKTRNSIKKCQNCLMEIFENFLDPIFAFIDCDEDGIITAENIWNSLKILRRKELRDPNQFNIYNCDINGSKIRTTAINDFVLKSETSRNPGKLDKTEWRYGILLGYWTRQIDKSTLLIDDSKNMKPLRWRNNGAFDIDCLNIKNNVKN